MKVNKFIRNIKNETFNKIRNSKGDAECRRFLKEDFSEQSILKDKYVIINFRNMDFMKNEDGEINYYNTLE